MRFSLMTFMCELPLLLEGEWTEEKSSRILQLISDAGKAGYTGVDLVAETLKRIGRERIERALKEQHLELTSVICVGRLADPAIPDDQAETPYLQALDDAAYLGCSHLMLVPGRYSPDAATSDIRKVLKKRFRHLVDAAAAKDIICMIEDDPNLHLGMCRQSDVADMLQSVPGLKLVYDSANMIVAGEEPVSYFEALQDHVVHMHIKDICPCEDPEQYADTGIDGKRYASAMHGTGLVRFPELFGSICRAGYNGVLSMEYVPSGKKDPAEEIREIYRMFMSILCRCKVGVNEVGLIGKLVMNPYEDVWNEVKQRGAGSIEVCALPDNTERIRRYAEELSKKYPLGMPDCLARGDRIYSLVEGIKSCGLEVHSCHLMLCEAYPELVAESIPYMKEISRRTGIRQFVISCMFETAEMTKQYLPFIQEAAASLGKDGIALCYHNHDMDSTPLENGKTAMEMVLEECPDCMVQLDIGWAWYGHMDSVSFMKQYGERIASVHLKDLAEDARERSDDGRFTAVGAGAVPTKEALACLPFCCLQPGRLIIDQDASAGDMYEDISNGVRFIYGSMF